jgi:periplasmic protein TonB
MKPEMILQSDLLDILFENRNKTYGAYALRRQYPKQLLKSLGIMLSLIIIALSLQFFNTNKNIKNSSSSIPVGDSVFIREYEVPKEKPLQPIAKASAPKPPAASIVNRSPVVVPDELQNNKTPTIKELQNSIIGDSVKNGPEIELSSNPATQGEKEKGAGGGKESNGKEQSEIVASPDVRPEFPGGVEGWRRFLQKNLRGKESDEAYKIVVLVKFVVNEDGGITNLEIVQSGGAEFDNEVLKVMKKSPKWIAGSNGGRKVKVYHSQPVIFINQVDE